MFTPRKTFDTKAEAVAYRLASGCIQSRAAHNHQFGEGGVMGGAFPKIRESIDLDRVVRFYIEVAPGRSIDVNGEVN